MTIETIQILRNLKERIECMEAVVSKGEDANAVHFHYGVILKAIDDAIADQERLLPVPCETCGGEGYYCDEPCEECNGSGYAPIPPKAEDKKVLGLCVAAKNVRMCFLPKPHLKLDIPIPCNYPNCPHGKEYYLKCYGPGGSADHNMQSGNKATKGE
jgi:hypothetical protein